MTSSAMSVKAIKWPRMLGWTHVGLGIALYLGYWIYLPMQARVAATGMPDPGMILYAMATAGGAFVAWGMILRRVAGDSISRADVFRASAVGCALLGLMRLGTALFPHGPFVQMVALPVVECVTFLLLAWALFKAA